MRKGNKKGHKKGKKEESSQGKKDLSNVKCFRCHQKGHYANQCLEKKKKGKAKQQKIGCRECKYYSRVDELASQLETTFSMVSCLSSNTVSSVGWYVDSGASRHMTYDRKLFNKLQEQEGGMSVELGDDATYPVKGLGSISF
jgi:hypothetical protein